MNDCESVAVVPPPVLVLPPHAKTIPETPRATTKARRSFISRAYRSAALLQRLDRFAPGRSAIRQAEDPVGCLVTRHRNRAARGEVRRIARRIREEPRTHLGVA